MVSNIWKIRTFLHKDFEKCVNDTSNVQVYTSGQCIHCGQREQWDSVVYKAMHSNSVNSEHY